MGLNLFSLTSMTRFFAFGAEIEMNPHKFLHHFLAIVKCTIVLSLIYNIFLYHTIIKQSFFTSFHMIPQLLYLYLVNLTAIIFVHGTCLHFNGLYDIWIWNFCLIMSIARKDQVLHVLGQFLT